MWTPRQLMLPVLIAMSLTGVSMGILYLLIEKDKRDEDREAKGHHPHGFVTLEVSIPKDFVPAIIGRGGSTIKSIENTTSTRIRFNEEDTESPDRTCIVKGTVEGLRMAEAMIKNMMASQPLVETYETYVPQRVCPKIIGRGGETIRQIQISSKAKIIIDKSYSHNPNSKRRVIIKGTAEQIASALSQIEDKVHEYTDTLEKLVAGETARSPRGKISPRIPAVNPTPEIQLLSPPEDEQALHEGTMEVYVSAIENPSQFWVQVAGPGTLHLDALVAQMTAYYEQGDNRELHALKNITVGQTVAAKFLFDGNWYRAEVTSVTEEECEVYFLDYGDHEVVAIEHVLELRTDFLSLRLQAIECSLANVKPRDGEWSAEACERFGDLAWVAQWRVLIAKVRGYKERAAGRGSSRREGSPIPCVDLYDKNNHDINIGKQLVVENLAEAEEGTWSAASSTLSLSRRSENPTSPTSIRATPPVIKSISLSPENSTKPVNNGRVIEEVDLTTPQKTAPGLVEEIDLVTPTRQFIEAERSEPWKNGGGDIDNHRANGNEVNGTSKISRNILPAGYESDESEDSDGYAYACE